MPNWCNNVMTLTHSDPAMIDRATTALKEGTFLNEFFPCPRELHEHESPIRDADLGARFMEQYGATDWYNWQVQNWGTKWDVCAENGVDVVNVNTITASFESAWAPPTQAYEKLCALGFEIRAHYYEPGMCFVGTWSGDENDSFDDYYEYSGESSETVREVIGEELDDMFCISESMSEWEEEENE